MSRRSPALALAALVLPVLLISIDMTVLGTALPVLAEDLDPGAAEQLWIVDAYSFVLAGLLVTMGTLGDRIGRRRLLMWGAAAFGVASVLAAFAPTAGTLVVARALLGLGGATLMPSTFSLIKTTFPEPRRRATAVAVWSAAFSGGAAAGPVVGGRAARALLVGLGLPDQRPGDRAAAGGRPGRPAREPGPAPGPVRPGLGGAVARRDVPAGLGTQDRRDRGPDRRGRALGRRGRRRGHAVRPPPAPPRAPAAGPRTVLAPVVLGVGDDEPARRVRAGRPAPAAAAVPAVGARVRAARGRAVDAARLRRRGDGRAHGDAPGAPAHAARARRPRARDRRDGPRPRRRPRRSRRGRGRVRVARGGRRARGGADQRPDPRRRPGRPGRCRLGDLRDGLRARRGAGHRGARQPRGGRLHRPDGAGDPRRRARPRRGAGARSRRRARHRVTGGVRRRHAGRRGARCRRPGADGDRGLAVAAAGGGLPRSASRSGSDPAGPRRGTVQRGSISGARSRPSRPSRPAGRSGR